MEENKQPDQPQAPKSQEKNTGMAVVAYIIFFIPLFTDAKDDPFVKYHVKQGLMVFLIGLGATVLNQFFIFITFITWIIQILLLVLVILGIMNVLNNKKVPLPFIGQYAEKFKF